MPSSSHQPSHGSAWAWSARWETTVRWPWWSNASGIASSVTTRLAAATLPCFIDRITSSCSASVRPSISSEYAGRPALPMPKPLRPTMSLTV